MSRADIQLDLLDSITVASPCDASWSDMTGDDRVRRCGLCRLHVYNLSGMTRAEAEALAAEHDGNLCVRFFRRPDGTVITTDCPRGIRAVKRRMRRMLASIAAMLLLAAGAVRAVAAGDAGALRLRRLKPFTPPAMPVVTVTATPIMGKMIMGRVSSTLPFTAPVTPTAPNSATSSTTSTGVNR
jgi:hypothetical protein